MLVYVVADEVKEEHERREHQCSMGDRCIYFPEPGPDEPNGPQMCGLCPDCKTNNTVSYFCSKACYLKNAVSSQLSMF
jgi:hypothetical protein